MEGRCTGYAGVGTPFYEWMQEQYWQEMEAEEQELADLAEEIRREQEDARKEAAE